MIDASISGIYQCYVFKFVVFLCKCVFYSKQFFANAVFADPVSFNPCSPC